MLDEVKVLPRSTGMFLNPGDSSDSDVEQHMEEEEGKLKDHVKIFFVIFFVILQISNT